MFGSATTTQIPSSTPQFGTNIFGKIGTETPKQTLFGASTFCSPTQGGSSTISTISSSTPFSATTTTTQKPLGLFGNSTLAQTTAPTTTQQQIPGLFGSVMNATSSSTQPTSNIFAPTTVQQTQQTSSLFGNLQNSPQFGAATTTGVQQATSLFGSATNAQSNFAPSTGTL